MRAATDPAEQSDPANASLARSVGGNAYATDNNLVDLADAVLPPAGGGQAHANMQPYLALNFIIALMGVYPSRN
jgi:microcystin-dependent protein